MSLEKPSKEVEYSATGSTWTSLGDDVLEMEVRLSSLVQGVSTFRLKLDNDAGKYDITFPAQPTETGLAYLFRIKINGVTIIVGRSDEMGPELSAGEGDVYGVEGRCLGVELLNRYAWGPWTYPVQSPYTAASIIQHQYSKVGWFDVDYSKPSPDTTPTYSMEVQARTRYCRDIIAELCEALGYEAHVDSRAKPATLLFFPKNDPTRRLNVLLQSILYDQGNNIINAKIPRNLYTLKNKLYLREGQMFTGTVPSDGDVWTEALTGWTALNGVIALDSGFKTAGGNSIRGTASGSNGPMFSLDLGGTYGAVDVDALKALTLYWDFAVSRGKDKPDRSKVKTLLHDSQGRTAMLSLSTPDSDEWLSYGIILGPGSEGIYDAIHEDFDWKISRILFGDYEPHYEPGDVKLWVDALRFSSGVSPTESKTDDASVSRYGIREQEIQPPEGSHNVNLSQWGDLMLDKYSKPLRVLSLSALVDPSQVKLVDGVTPAPLAPGYSLQVDIPRWGVKKVADGGVYWRILEASHRFSARGGYTVGLELAPTEAFSEDYSVLSADRYLQSRNVVLGLLGRLIR